MYSDTYAFKFVNENETLRGIINRNDLNEAVHCRAKYGLN